MNKPKPKRILKPKDQASKIKDIALKLLHKDKAEDVVEIDLHEKTDVAHYMIVATGRSSKHVCSLADNLVEKLKDAGLEGINIEGKEKGDWVLIDANDVIIHIFRQETRELYKLEKLWHVEK